MNRGQFKPGHSGNPGGRPKQVLKLLRLARKHSRRALLFAVELLENTAEEGRVRLEAAKFITAYGLGAPPKVLEAETSAPRQEAADELTVDELRALARREVAMERAENEPPDGTQH